MRSSTFLSVLLLVTTASCGDDTAVPVNDTATGDANTADANVVVDASVDARLSYLGKTRQLAQ